MIILRFKNSKIFPHWKWNFQKNFTSPISFSLAPITITTDVSLNPSSVFHSIKLSNTIILNDNIILANLLSVNALKEREICVATCFISVERGGNTSMKRFPRGMRAISINIWVRQWRDRNSPGNYCLDQFALGQNRGEIFFSPFLFLMHASIYAAYS